MIKVAGYCRVSTDREDQANSFESQQRFFKEYIERHPEWELFEIYADEGISGTSTRKRAEFNRMINDAYSHRFKLIITKEVSRFSRNILDTIAYTRELKALGIGVFFMSDGFNSLDSDAELRLSIMGSIAQEESRKTSARVKWGQKRQMERGVVFGTSMLGYDVREGRLFVNPDGAQVVRQIFLKYGVEKKGTTVIARELREAGYQTCSGNRIWSNSHILKILKNEKYVGDLVQKKTITPDYLTHAKKYNHGEEDMVILRNHHEPIITRELWELVQEEIRKRNRNNHHSAGRSRRYVFSGKIKCSQCGASFIARTRRKEEGTSCKRWGCYNAVKYGTKKQDIQGNVIGCDIGKVIRQELAMDMLKYVICDLDIDLDQIIRNLTSLIMGIISNETQSTMTDKLNQQREKIENKKLHAIDLYLSGDLTKEELDRMKRHYDSLLEKLKFQLEDHSERPDTNIENMKIAIKQRLESMLSCKEISEQFLKEILERITVHKNGTMDVKLNSLSTIWKFRMVYGKFDEN